MTYSAYKPLVTEIKLYSWNKRNDFISFNTLHSQNLTHGKWVEKYLCETDTFSKRIRLKKVKAGLHIEIYYQQLIYIYMVIHRQISFVLSEPFSVGREDRFPKLGSKPCWFKCQSKVLPLSYEENSASEGNLNAYVSDFFFFLHISA